MVIQGLKKPRMIAVIYQRKDDDALVLVKIYSYKWKYNNSNNYIKNFILKQKKHSSLTTNSAVDSKLNLCRKENGNFKIIVFDDLKPTDMLTRYEYYYIKKHIGNNRKYHKVQYKKLKRWKKHFKK